MSETQPDLEQIRADAVRVLYGMAEAKEPADLVHLMPTLGGLLADTLNMTVALADVLEEHSKGQFGYCRSCGGHEGGVEWPCETARNIQAAWRER